LLTSPLSLISRRLSFRSAACARDLHLQDKEVLMNVREVLMKIGSHPRVHTFAHPPTFRSGGAGEVGIGKPA
jgi:hypothetical protein